MAYHSFDLISVKLLPHVLILKSITAEVIRELINKQHQFVLLQKPYTCLIISDSAITIPSLLKQIKLWTLFLGLQH